MSAFLGIVFAVAFAVLKLVAGHFGLQIGRDVFARGGTRRRRTSLLQPSQSMTETHVRALNRVPVEPRLKPSGRLGIWKRLRLLNLRPSSPKPILLLAEPPVEEQPESGSGPWGLDVGGSRLILRCHPSEDALHMKLCIRAGSVRTAKTLMVCSIGDYFGSRESVKVYSVAWNRVHLRHDSDDTVIAYGADTLYTAVDTQAHLAQRDDSHDVVWLLYDETDDDGSAADMPPGDASEADPETAGGLSRSERFPWRILRICRIIAATVLTAVTVLLSIAWYRSVDNPNDLQPVEQLGAIPLGILWYLVLILSFGHGLNCLAYEAWRPPRWTATTTRCYDDGRILRNGYFRSVRRRRRFV